MPNVTRPKAQAVTLSSLLMKFKDTVPIIQALCNPALSSPGLDDANTQEIFDVLVFVNHDNAKLEDMNIRSLQNYSVE